MKSIITTTALLLLLSFQTFPQDKNHKKVLLERFSVEKLMGIHKSNVDALEEQKDNKYWLLNSKISRWKQVLKKQQEGFCIEKEFHIKDSKTTIKKTSLGDGFLLIEFIGQNWYGSAWVNSWKISYTYDGNNNRTEYLDQNWDGSTWVNSWKYSYTYDENNYQTELLIQFWDGSAWENSSRSFLTYDENNNLTEDLNQNWDGSAWVNSSKTTYTYGGNNNRIATLGQFWDGSNWLNSLKLVSLYIPTGIGQFETEVNTYSLSNNYPNPFNPTTKINYTIPEKSNVSLKIFNLLGSEVAELVKGEVEAGSYIIDFNAFTLPSGVYFYRLQAGTFLHTKKMILLR